MKISFLLLLSSLASLSTFGQVIHGRVLDKETREPIDFASVFFNGTFHGTSTGENGEFELDVAPYTGRTLQVSAMGYSSSSLNSSDTLMHHEVLLERVLYEISEVSVESKSLARKKKAYMRIFRDEFIGLTRNAGACYIMNEDDITFNYHSCKDTLRATARKPLLILNEALGYQITYFLDKFEYDKRNNTTTFKGNIAFNMDLSTNPGLREKYESRREKTYRGSCKHFFSALWENRMVEEGFSVQEQQSLQPVTYQDMVVELKGKKYFSYRETLEIYYNLSPSTATFRGQGVYFAADGYFEPEGILWYGDMSMDRIAEWLPYEYSPQ